jgi:16S rRNA (cytosine1402-N4)-methyltransferase
MIPSMSEPAKHIPVLLNEVLETLSPRENEIYVDGTFGYGGYTRAILDTATCNVIAIDQDKHVFELARNWSEPYKDRLQFVHGRFSNIQTHLASFNIDKVDGIVIDIGVSSMQIDEAMRGFSFRFDGALDMRMDQSQGQTAADLVNTLPEEELANLIYQFGEERHSRRIAAAIVKRRLETPFQTTLDLANIIRDVVPKSFKDKIDPATRTFQALRIAVNDELGELERLLEAAVNILNKNGRLIVVTFHSLEDRIVKNFMLEQTKHKSAPSRYIPHMQDQTELSFALITKKPITANDDEIIRNPRARSAKLRAMIKTREAS